MLTDPAGEDRDGARTGTATIPGPTRARPVRPGRAGPGLRGPGLRGPGPACAMRAQLTGIHPTSRRASSARRNPPPLDSCDPTSHNASQDDITESTPPRPRRTTSRIPERDLDFPGTETRSDLVDDGELIGGPTPRGRGAQAGAIPHTLKRNSTLYRALGALGCEPRSPDGNPPAQQVDQADSSDQAVQGSSR